MDLLCLRKVKKSKCHLKTQLTYKIEQQISDCFDALATVYKPVYITYLNSDSLHKSSEGPYIIEISYYHSAAVPLLNW